MWYAIAALCFVIGGGAGGYLYGAKVEALAWKKAIGIKGWAVAEIEDLRKAL